MFLNYITYLQAKFPVSLKKFPVGKVASLSTLDQSVHRLDYRLSDHRKWVQFLTGREVFLFSTAITAAAYPLPPTQYVSDASPLQ